MCYNTAEGELDVSMLTELIGEHKITDVELGGGEPTLHPELDVFVKACIERDIPVNIATNGSILREDIIALPKKELITWLVSIYSANPDVHDRITRANHYHTAMKNIQELKKHFKVGLNTAIYNGNFDEVDEMIVLGKDLDIPLRINLVYPVGRGKNVKVLTHKQVKELQSKVIVECIFNRGVDSPLIRPNNCYAIRDYFGIPKTRDCPVDIGSKIYVNQKGKRSVCEFMEE
jgi:MoaA/NifB/PqqE/SkfB family radical SAM enzyme